jgi:hypothetical protein
MNSILDEKEPYFKEIVMSIRSVLNKYSCDSEENKEFWIHVENNIFKNLKNITFERGKEPNIKKGKAELINLWKSYPFLASKIRYILDILPMQYVKYTEFVNASIKLFENICYEIIHYKVSKFIYLNRNKKSNNWIFFCFLKYCHDKNEKVYKLIKSKLRIYDSEILREPHYDKCYLYGSDVLHLLIDDAAYSGKQITDAITNISTYSSGHILIGVVYTNPNIIENIKKIEKYYTNNINFIHINKIDILSQDIKKEIQDNDVQFYKNKNELINYSLYNRLGLWVDSTTYFEHKVPDYESIPRFMAEPLYESSPERMLPKGDFWVKENEDKLILYTNNQRNNEYKELGWIYGDFCDDHNYNAIRQTCFTPKYKHNDLEIYLPPSEKIQVMKHKFTDPEIIYGQQDFGPGYTGGNDKVSNKNIYYSFTGIVICFTCALFSGLRFS